MLPSQRAAQAIFRVLRNLGLDINQFTCMVADNANFNDALAKLLGIPRLRCVPHALQLVWAEVTKLFDLFITCTSGVSALLGAGGGTSRKNLVRSVDLVPTSLHCVSTRWGQTAKVAEYLLEGANFDTLRTVMKGAPEFALPKKKAGKKGAAAAEQEEDAVEDLQEVQVGPSGRRVKVTSVLQSCRDAFEVDVADGARTRESLFQLNLVFTIAPKITEAIKLFSGNVATTDYGAGINMLNELRLSLGDAAEQGNQDAAIDAAISDGGLVLNGKERERVSS
jgi:hypothetical protein